MCGLAGWYGECNVSRHQQLRRAKALEGLLLANAERGTDATGVGMVYNDHPLAVYKRAIDSYKMVNDPFFSRIIRAEDATMAIGHTRYKTMGFNKDKNAHPFKEGSVLGAHNGMIFNYSELEMYYSDSDFEPLRVDSQSAFRLLSDTASDKPDDIVSALELINGSLALTWHDEREPDTLWLFRHYNPLSVAIVPHIRSMFWSSQPEHLAIVMQSVYGNKWYNFVVKENTLYRMSWSKKEDVVLYDDWHVDMVTYGKGNPYSSKGSENKSSGKKDKKKNKEKSIVIFDSNDEATYAWEDRALGEGMQFCDMCKKIADWDDRDTTFLANEDCLLCGECYRWWTNEGLYTYENQLPDAIKVMQSLGFGGNA